METTLPTDSAARKAIPITTGVLDYFPAALAAVAMVSKAGNDKHNPGQPLHHSRGKSTDHADSVGRHLIERGGIDPDTGQRHSAEMAWRALALLQQELEDAGEAPLARAAWRDPDVVLPGEPENHPTIHDDIVIDQSVLREVERLREEHARPATVADIQSRNDFNAGVEAAALYLKRDGWDGLAEEVEALKA